MDAEGETEADGDTDADVEREADTLGLTDALLDNDALTDGDTLAEGESATSHLSRTLCIDGCGGWCRHRRDGFVHFRPNIPRRCITENLYRLRQLLAHGSAHVVICPHDQL